MMPFLLIIDNSNFNEVIEMRNTIIELPAIFKGHVQTYVCNSSPHLNGEDSCVAVLNPPNSGDLSSVILNGSVANFNYGEFASIRIQPKYFYTISIIML